MIHIEIERPDLSQLDPDVRAYIESLEAEVERLSAAHPQSTSRAETPSSAEADEPPTTINVVTFSAGGLIKRTPRHLYSRQRRGGMGVFDLEVPEGDRTAGLALADESDTLLVLTNLARAFRLPLRDLPASPLRSKGIGLAARLSLQRDEHAVVVLPVREAGYLTVLSWRGYVRCMPYNIFGLGLNPGAGLFKTAEFGSLAAACWTSGDDDLFIATRKGSAIRFSERVVPIPGCAGIRLDEQDAAVAVAAVRAESGVFLLGADGRGTIRMMSGFAPNKAPGGGGKLAMKVDHLVGALRVDSADDVFVISRLSKIIRFRAAEVPAKEGVVQGVNCMALRADDAVAIAGGAA